ncbi:myb-like protein X isoform X1 [Monomorium pharaonis]|uniref:myb-like protein X isoform X1 n=1 Tax=Monomorium pharaonis TaxID=307658 RepID=UPI001745F3E6|nr:myb-like protein X isoform X1 [Monomorium pharaonis]
MYLIECDDDASLCIVEDHEIICDDESVQIGNIVQFVYQKKLYKGRIIMHSDNITILREEVKKLGAKKMINKTQSDIILSETRIRKKPKIYSPNGSNTTQEKLPNKRKLKRNAKNWNKPKESKHSQQSVSKLMKENQCLMKEHCLQNCSSTSSEEESLLKNKKQKDYSCNKQRDINALKIINNNSLESFDKNVTTDKQLPNKSSIQEINCRNNLKQDLIQLSLTKKSRFHQGNEKSNENSTSSEEESLSENKKQDYSCNKQRDNKALKIINNNSLEFHDKNVTADKQLPNKSSIRKINCRDNLRLISNENSTSSEEERLSENEKQEVQYSRNNDDCEEIYDPVIAAAKMLTKPDQLYGKYWPHEPMVLLINDVYCRKKIWMSALGNSKAVTHLARRLIVGVFKKEKLLKCTLSGQPPRAQGKERQNEEIEGLDVRAKDAIIDYAILMGESKNWNVPDRRVIERSMTQQIGRLKLELKQALVREQD